ARGQSGAAPGAADPRRGADRGIGRGRGGDRGVRRADRAASGASADRPPPELADRAERPRRSAARAGGRLYLPRAPAGDRTAARHRPLPVRRAVLPVALAANAAGGAVVSGRRLGCAGLIVGGRLHGVSAILEPGRITAICGPNGAGKSTLLQCLAGVLAPDAGEVLLDGAPLPSGRARARRVGYLPQTG